MASEYQDISCDVDISNLPVEILGQSFMKKNRASVDSNFDYDEGMVTVKSEYLMSIKQQSQKMKQQLIKKNNHINYLSTQSLNYVMNYLDTLESQKKLEQKDKQINELSQKLDKSKKKIQKYKNLCKNLQQNLKLQIISKQSIEQKFLGEIQNYKSKIQLLESKLNDKAE